MTHRLRPIALLTLVVLLASGCAAGAPSPSPSPGRELTVAELKYRLIDEFGPLRYCDPDEYPVSRGDEDQQARERLPEIQADREAFTAILDRLGLDASAEFEPGEQLAIYREWKLLNAILLEPAGNGSFRFALDSSPDSATGRGIHTAGTIDAAGEIQIEQQGEAPVADCPICLARGTLIDTPRGPVRVEDLRIGDPVWTLNARGRRIPGVVLAVGSARVPSTHQVVHLVLDDGRELWASPGHPLPDATVLGDLRPGHTVDGARVVTADLVAYGGPATFDLLPSGPTGTYWADGILLGSTLGR